MIKFNEVTWYSRLLALLLFIGALPVLTFYIGMQYQQTQDAANTVPAVSDNAQSHTLKRIASATYMCDAGKTIAAVYYEGKPAPQGKPGEPPIPTGSVSVSLDGGTAMMLKQTLSASGVRYANADESFVFWNKGNEALIMRNNTMDLTYKNCATKQ